MAILIARGDERGPEIVKTAFVIAMSQGDRRGVEDVAETIVKSGIDVPELRVPAHSPLREQVGDVFRQYRVKNTKLVYV